MPGIFRTNNPFSIIILFFYGILLRFAAFGAPHIPQAQSTDGFLYLALLRALENAGLHSPIIYSVLAYLLVFIQALAFNKAFNNHKLLPKSNYLPAFCYVLVTALFPEWCNLSSSLIVNSFMIWIWSSMTDLYKNTNGKQLLFNIGIAIGICSFFYFPSIGFVVLLFAALLIMRPASVPEWLISVLGITTPYYFLFAWRYLTGKWNLSAIFPSVHLSYPVFQQTFWAWGGLLLLIVPFLASGIYIQGAILRMLIQVRKGWSLLLVYLLISLLIPFINATSSFAYWILSAVPFAAFHAGVFFSPRKKFIPNLLHAVMLLFILAMNYYLLKA